MTPERWQQIKAVFESALEIEASQRKAFVDRACNGDSSLQQEVESLLRSHNQVSQFPERPSVVEEYCPAGQSIGHYEVLRQIGRGGMGEVYLAKDKRLGRHVALKFLPASVENDLDRRARLLTEAQAASLLHSPNIAGIYDVGEENGHSYIVMEYVDGELLSVKLKAGPLAINSAIDFAIQTAEALDEAHINGIVHRDIKTSNLMITPRGHVKVLDFGLAKITQHQADDGSVTLKPGKTEPGMVMGTVHYMSPEQARGLAVDSRSDLFSLGVVLYEMLTGRLPFDGPTNSDVLAAILEREPEPASRRRPEIPGGLEEILRRCLAKEREGRYGLASEIEADLKRVQKGELLIQADLIDVLDGSQIWGEQFSRKSSELLAVQDEIVQQISQKLRSRLTRDQRHRISKPTTKNVLAYQLYLKGRYYWDKRTADSLMKGIEHFEQACQIDPGYAIAHAGMADCYAALGSFSVLSPRDSYPKARAAAERALALDDKLAEAHTSLAWVKTQYDWDWPAAEREYRTAIELNPNYATAHYWYALFLTSRSRNSEAIRSVRRAQELEPLSLVVNTVAGFVYYWSSQYDRAIEQSKKTIDLDTNYFFSHWVLGLALEQQSKYEDAIVAFRKASELSGQGTLALSSLGHVLAVSGNQEEARNILHDLKESRKEKYVASYFLSLICAGLGLKDEALEWLHQAYQDRSWGMIWAGVDPRLRELRTDARCQKLINGMELPNTTL